MRKYCLGPFIVTLLLGATCAVAQTGMVAHFNPITKQWDTQQIAPNFTAKWITTAKQYAFATNDFLPCAPGMFCGENFGDTVAFYDGAKWHAPQKIAGIDHITALYLAHPIDGKDATAWILGLDAEQHQLLSYFDGKTWSPATPFDDDAYLIISGGRAWKTGGWSNIISVSAKSDPTSWVQVGQFPTSYRDNYQPLPYSFVDRGDEQGLYMGHEDRQNQQSTIFKLMPDGQTEEIYTTPGVSISQSSVSNNYIYLDTGRLTAVSTNDAANWTPVDTYLSATYPYTVSHGVICGDGYHGYACINGNEASPVEQQITFPSYVPSTSDEVLMPLMQVRTTPIGAFFTCSNADYVFFYNAITHTLTDTHFRDVASWASYLFRVVGDDNAFTCTVNANTVNGLYFDGKTWHAQPLPALDSSSGCGTSLAGSSNLRIFQTDNNNVWIY